MSAPDFEYALGSLVAIDSTGGLHPGRIGRVVCHVTDMGGSRGYVVSAYAPHEDQVKRHWLIEAEIRLPLEKDFLAPDCIASPGHSPTPSTPERGAQRDGISENERAVENRGRETPAPNRAQGE